MSHEASTEHLCFSWSGLYLVHFAPPSFLYICSQLFIIELFEPKREYCRFCHYGRQCCVGNSGAKETFLLLFLFVVVAFTLTLF